jgi:Fe2+ or Zn2+ uptake regulation protein
MMSGLSKILTEDRRLTILRTLAEDHDHTVNEFVLRRALSALGHEVFLDTLRMDLRWLEEQRLVTVDRMQNGEVWVATASEDGVKVARGKPHAGVARPMTP